MKHDLPDFDLDGYVPYQLAVAASQLSKALAVQYRGRFGISMPEWRVLVNVGYSDKVSVRDIERRVSLEKSKVSRAASKLEAAGYITKTVDDDDRRLLKLELTAEGAALLTEIVPIARSFQAKVETALAAEFATFQSALTTLMELDDA
ncbi:MarR family winged helix-turn-helix transcriptional regulator [Celeribacter sp.]|uniref:MarR family winged helix-turn-helix transcriptional regulator n=1 Tax=Celeribacter sp. TaxID=1890673 RepID=UPI003A932C2C